MKCFVGHQGEGEGLFGGGGDAEVVGGKDLDWVRFCRCTRLARRKSGFELRHDDRIFCAAAGDDELVDFVFG